MKDLDFALNVIIRPRMDMIDAHTWSEHDDEECTLEDNQHSIGCNLLACFVGYSINSRC